MLINRRLIKDKRIIAENFPIKSSSMYYEKRFAKNQ